MGGVKVSIKARKVTVEGKLGKLFRDLSHINADIRVEGGKVVVESWFTAMKQKSSLKSALASVVNMMNGVQIKYKKMMRLAYSHFPINVTITNGGKGCEIRNFQVEKSKDVKDEIYVEGTDIELVGRSAALINQSCLVKRKDIRKFLDGIYVSSYGTTEEQKSVI